MHLLPVYSLKKTSTSWTELIYVSNISKNSFKISSCSGFTPKVWTLISLCILSKNDLIYFSTIKDIWKARFNAEIFW